MNISEPFIRRPVATSLLAAGVFLLGIIAWIFLPVASLPNVEYPTISVKASLPGADPETMASSVASPLERHFTSIAGIDEITSQSMSGVCWINLQFSLSRNIDRAARDVQAAINASASELPEAMPSLPMLKKTNPNDIAVIVLALTSDSYRPTELYDFAYQLLVPKISQIPGVSEVDIKGSAKPAIRIRLNPSMLGSMGLTVDDVRNSIVSANALLPKGSMVGDTLNYSIESNDQLLKPEDYENLMITKGSTGVIKLGDLAQIVLSNENAFATASFNGKRAVFLLIRKQAGTNIIDVSNHVMAALPQLRSWLPSSVNLSIITERTGTIRASLREVKWSLLLSLLLVGLICFVFLRKIKIMLIALITVPLCFAGTFIVLWLLHESIDNLSLMALIVAVGFVVDDAIVVIEVIVREIELGASAFEAALIGSKQIGFTVISISISLIAAFIPIFFMNGLPGRMLHEFAICLAVAIILSALVSLILTPMLCSRFLKNHADEKENFISRWFEMCFQKLLALYGRILRSALQQKRVMFLLMLVTLVLTIWLYVISPKGFFPTQDTGMIVGVTEAGQDISFRVMEEKQKQIDAIIQSDPGVNTVGSFISGSSNKGNMMISLKPQIKRKSSAEEIIARLSHLTASLPGISLFLQPVQDIRIGGRVSKGLYIYALDGPDFKELTEWVPQLVEKLKKIPQLKNVSSDQEFLGLQASVVIDHDKASRLGITTKQIDSLLYSAFGQRQITTLYTPRNEYHVVLEVERQFLEDPSALHKVFLMSSTGQQVPLSAVTHLEMGNTALSVPHQGEFPTISISFNTAPGVALGEAVELINQASKEIHFPANIHGSFQGTAKVFAQSQKSQVFLILAALIAVYLVLGILYESFIHPMTIISTLPSAGLGALLALRYYRMDLSIVAIIGIILLIGIVKKNAILMIDYALDAKKKISSLSAHDAIYQACMARFRPIIMTTFAALFGALPLAFAHGDGSEFRQPLGITIVGGLIVSQALTLFTTPVIFLLLERFRRKEN
ncbi:MAG: efflux RND transporter permease subunit [Chthoniobacterales bacterium]